MDSNSALQLVILILLLVLSGFFSSAETSLTTVSTIRLLSLAEQGNKRAQTVLKIRKDSGKMLSAILIGNNIVNLTASSLATTLAINLLGSAAVGIATGILTFLVLMFGEITPKTLATIHAEKFALSYANVISWLMKILTPVIFIINHLSRFVLKLLHVDPNAKPSFMTEHELRTIVDVSHENGVIESDERQMINNVFDFGDSTAKDIMIPRVDMVCADIDSTYEELLEIFRAERFTRIPVYRGRRRQHGWRYQYERSPSVSSCEGISYPGYHARALFHLRVQKDLRAHGGNAERLRELHHRAGRVRRHRGNDHAWRISSRRSSATSVMNTTTTRKTRSAGFRKMSIRF